MLLTPTLLLAGLALGADPEPPPSNEASTVSMVRILADPLALHGLKVKVVGWWAPGPGGGVLYFHKDDATAGIVDNAVQLFLTEGAAVPAPKDVKDGAYVEVEGDVDATAHAPEFCAGLRNVSRVTRWAGRPAPDGGVPSRPPPTARPAGHR